MKLTSFHAVETNDQSLAYKQNQHPFVFGIVTGVHADEQQTLMYVSCPRTGSGHVLGIPKPQVRVQVLQSDQSDRRQSLSQGISQDTTRGSVMGPNSCREKDDCWKA